MGLRERRAVFLARARRPGFSVGLGTVLAAIIVGLLVHLFGPAAPAGGADEALGAHHATAAGVQSAVEPAEHVESAAQATADGECSDFVRTVVPAATPLTCVSPSAVRPAAPFAHGAILVDSVALAVAVDPHRSPGVQRI